MKTRLRSLLPWCLPLLALIGSLLHGCGGGSGGVGVGGTGSFAAGPITGFGSVIVNEVAFDDSSARIEDLDGERSRRDELRLGMSVEVESGAISQGFGGASASASRIVVAAEMLGPVSAVNRGAGTLVVLGQTVVAGDSTVWEGTTLAALGAGQLVEVHAQIDPAAARYRATRIEARGTAASYRLRGVVAQLDAAARSFGIGAANFTYAGAGNVPAALAVGNFVRVSLATAPDSAGRWRVLAFGAGERRPPEADGARIKGIITRFTSAAAFAVNGVEVDASGARFPDGSAGLGAGMRVEVEGDVRSGTLRATRVSIASDERERARGFDLKGTITAASAATRSFVVRGVAVTWAPVGVRFDNGSASDLTVGRNVEVNGLLSADGTRLEALRIRFD